MENFFHAQLNSSARFSCNCKTAVWPMGVKKKRLRGKKIPPTLRHGGMKNYNDRVDSTS